MTTLTHSFKAFKALAGSLKAAMPGASDMALELQHLRASASQQEDGAFLVQIQGFLKRLKSRLETVDLVQNPEIFQHLEKLFSTFGDFIQGAEPQLAADIKAALAQEDANKKQALLKLLEEQQFAAALAPHLKAFFTAPNLTRQEHTDAIKGRMSESMGELHQRVSDQAIYDPEKAPWLYFFKILFNLVEMLSAPPPRSSLQKDKAHAAKPMLIPMPR
ncbi:MAG: hypothetical protein KBD23_02690 [Gammaproteobacteria bacterium]|nr:hypothetical protein [Gammaproteobacteria bacterium]MBP9729032.1 hypothetical protein [Gammaproteobacteria bacterium]